MGIIALEEVLDGGTVAARRHSGDYWVNVFGDPAATAMVWRFEAHLSVTMTVADMRSLRPVSSREPACVTMPAPVSGAGSEET